MATQLVFIPGLACDSRMWQHQTEVFTDALVAKMGTQTTIDAMAEALLAQHAGPLILCGASMGGMVALAAVRQAPERIRGLALLGTTAAPETDEMRQLREAAIQLFSLGRMRDVLLGNVGLAFHPEAQSNTVLVDGYLKWIRDAGAEALIRQNRVVMQRPDARPYLPHIRVPTLVLCGDSDQLTSPECMTQIAALIPGAELCLIDRCGHMLTVERPDAVNACLADWLRRHFGQ